jgi:DNA polymerase (family 10)
MPIHNNDVAEIFNKVADMLDIEGANQFRVRAYRNAARTIGDLPGSVADLVERGEDLSRLPGLGRDLAGKIGEIVETGALKQLEELEGRIPKDLNQLMRIEGLGPKRIKALHRELGIKDVEGLKRAAREDRIKDLKGFGPKTQQQIVEQLERLAAEPEQRLKLANAEKIAEDYVNYLEKDPSIKKINVAGSFRRRKETVGDLDILATVKRGSKVMDHFAKYEDVAKVISKGKTRSSVALRSALHVDLRVMPEVCYGAAMHYLTGSKAHNIAVRKLGVQKGLKINEYGVFKGKKEKRVAGKTEAEVFEQVDLPYIPPELREDRGEVQAAQKDRLPYLLDLKDIRGDLHTHTKETDGRNTLEEMADAAKDHGYDYLAVTEHSQRVSMAKGLDAKRLAEHIKKIDRLNGRLKDLRLLKSIEVDILEDGSLDLPDDILKELDLTVCSVHYHRKLSRQKQTDRILRAMDNPHFHILAHPTGRLIRERDPYEVDIEKVLKGARERNCFVELNAHPDRLDLTDRHCKMAKDLGVKIAVSTDAHSTTDLDFMRFGVYQACRGWLEKQDVINTRKWKDLKQLLKR